MGGAAAQLQSNRTCQRTLLAHAPLARRRPRTNEHPSHRHRNRLSTQYSALQRCMPARTLTRRVARRAALLARGEPTTCSRPLSTPLTSCWFQLHFPESRRLAGPCLRHTCHLCSCPSWCHCLLSFNLPCFPLKHTSQKFVGEGPASGLTLWTPCKFHLASGWRQLTTTSRTLAYHLPMITLGCLNARYTPGGPWRINTAMHSLSETGSSASCFPRPVRSLSVPCSRG